MRKRLAVLCLFPVLVASACRSDEVDLGYRYDDPAIQRLTYIMDARAEARWDIGEPGTGSYRVRFEVSETIEPETDGGAVVSVTMTRVDVEEDGLLSPGSEERSFVLRLGPNGEKLEVLEVDGVPATALDDDELALIGTYRPPLPLEPVGLGDTWNAQQELSIGSVFQQVDTTGELQGLHRDDDGDRIAELDYSGSGPVSQTLRLPQGAAALTGDTEVEIDADLDIDNGVLMDAISTTHGVFEARVIPEGQEAPIVGSLDLELHLRLRQTESV